MLKHTPLAAAHRAAGARMIEFAGWEMPLHYGSQLAEHHAVRRDAGIFDVAHMLTLDVTGPAAREFLRRALTNDVDRLKLPGKALYACLLNERGGILDDLIAWRFADDRYRLVVNAATADKDCAWLERLRTSIAGELSLTPRADLAILSVQGPHARGKAWIALPELRAASSTLAPFQAANAGDLMISRTGYTGEDGFELFVPAERAAALWSALVGAGVHPCGLAARDTLRLEAGLNLYGSDMDETSSPLESGLGWTVDLSTERDFVGRAALGVAAPRRQLLGLVLAEQSGVLRSHQGVHAPQGSGEVTSGTFSPTLLHSIGLARLPLGVAPHDAVLVDMRGKQLPAVVVKPPFVRNGASCLQDLSGAWQ